jgi:hypothetical protein
MIRAGLGGVAYEGSRCTLACLMQVVVGVEAARALVATYVYSARMNLRGAAGSKLLGSCLKFERADSGNSDKQEAATFNRTVPYGDVGRSASPGGHHSHNALRGSPNRPDEALAKVGCPTDDRVGYAVDLVVADKVLLESLCI